MGVTLISCVMKIPMDMLRIPDIIAAWDNKECCTGTFESANATIKKIQNTTIRKTMLAKTLLVTYLNIHSILCMTQRKNPACEQLTF